MSNIKIKELVIASNNEGKIQEIKLLLPTVICSSQKEYTNEAVPETATTFIENALIKAKHLINIVDQPVLADDSGLIVEALDGEPGIKSARYAGENADNEANINLLLERMSNIPEKNRQAYFYCAMVLLRSNNDPAPIIATGKFKGFISTERIGSQGFGYDPIFYLPDYQCTVAELPLSTKNQISHRAQALNNLIKELQE